jgi:hypothetical protein
LGILIDIGRYRHRSMGRLQERFGDAKGLGRETRDYGVGWMPWGQMPMKDAASGETPGGAASTQRSQDFRMGKPGGSDVPSLRETSEGTR